MNEELKTGNRFKKSMLKKRNFWLTIITLIIIIFLWGYYLYTKPHQSAADENPETSIAAAALYSQYMQNEHVADLKYLDKVIEVTGILSDTENNNGTKIWTLSPQKNGGGISCQMFPVDENSLLDIKIGDSVTIKGKCTGFLADVNIVDCVPEQK